MIQPLLFGVLEWVVLPSLQQMTSRINRDCLRNKTKFRLAKPAAAIHAPVSSQVSFVSFANLTGNWFPGNSVSSQQQPYMHQLKVCT